MSSSNHNQPTHHHDAHMDDSNDDDTLGLMLSTAGSGRQRPQDPFAKTNSSRFKNCLVCNVCCCAICVIFATSLITLIYFSLLFAFPIRDPDLQWDWKRINTSDIYFPPDFIFGTATAAHQGLHFYLLVTFFCSSIFFYTVLSSGRLQL